MVHGNAHAVVFTKILARFCEAGRFKSTTNVPEKLVRDGTIGTEEAVSNTVEENSKIACEINITHNYFENFSTTISISYSTCASYIPRDVLLVDNSNDLGWNNL